MSSSSIDHWAFAHRSDVQLPPLKTFLRQSGDCHLETILPHRGLPPLQYDGLRDSNSSSSSSVASSPAPLTPSADSDSGSEIVNDNRRPSVSSKSASASKLRPTGQPTRSRTRNGRKPGPSNKIEKEKNSRSSQRKSQNAMELILVCLALLNDQAYDDPFLKSREQSQSNSKGAGLLYTKDTILNGATRLLVYLSQRRLEDAIKHGSYEQEIELWHKVIREGIETKRPLAGSCLDPGNDNECAPRAGGNGCQIHGTPDWHACRRERAANECHAWLRRRMMATDPRR